MVRKYTFSRLISLLSAAVLMFVCLCCGGISQRADAYENSDFSDEYGAFLYALGEKESGNDYGALSYDGQYMGRWQIGSIGLQDLGFMDSAGNWTALAASYGAYSKESFLASPAAQDYAVLASHKKILYYAENTGVTGYIGTYVNGVQMTFAGMIVAAHALGIGGLRSLLVNGTSGNSGNDALAVSYMQLCGGYNIENTVRNGALPLPPSYTEETTTTTTTTTTATTTTTTETTTATTVTTANTTETTTTATKLLPPKYISVKLSSNVAIVNKMFEIKIESDTAERYLIAITAPDGEETQYSLTGSSIGVTLGEEGLHTIKVTGYNKAGSSQAEPVYVAVQEKVLVSEEHLGDANDDGTVDLRDVSLILRYYSSLASGVTMGADERFSKYYADVNDDGDVDIADASYVLAYYTAVSSGQDASWSDILLKA